MSWGDTQGDRHYLEMIAFALAERNAIEKAKLAEMRAARWLHPDHTNGQGGSVWTSGSSAGHKAMQTADRLTAEVLGESDE